jgi:2-iminoacetate synthase ThiH
MNTQSIREIYMYSRVYIEITNVCNMSCSFCHGHSREKKFMTQDEFGKILDRLEDWDRVGVRRCGVYGSQNAWRKREDSPAPTPEEPFTEAI